MTFWLVQFFNGLQFSMLLFILSVGLTVIFGLLHFVNLAHGSFYAFGAYIGYSIIQASGNYWLSFVTAPVAVMLIGIAVYVLIIRRMRHSGHMNQVLVTFGLILIFLDTNRIVWGDVALGIDPPTIFAGQLTIGTFIYPLYRFFIIALGGVMMIGFALIMAYSQIGAMIRAGVDNREMASCLGLNVEKIFFVAFCVGCALAGLAGVAAAPVLSVTPNMGVDVLIPALIVIVIGGLGSLRGAIAGSFLVGFMDTFGAVFAPQLAALLVYALLAGVLIFKPVGLFPAARS